MNQEEIQTQIEAIRTELNKGDFDSMAQKKKVQQMLEEIYFPADALRDVRFTTLGQSMYAVTAAIAVDGHRRRTLPMLRASEGALFEFLKVTERLGILHRLLANDIVIQRFNRTQVETILRICRDIEETMEESKKNVLLKVVAAYIFNNTMELLGTDAIPIDIPSSIIAFIQGHTKEDGTIDYRAMGEYFYESRSMIGDESGFEGLGSLFAGSTGEKHADQKLSVTTAMLYWSTDPRNDMTSQKARGIQVIGQKQTNLWHSEPALFMSLKDATESHAGEVMQSVRVLFGKNDVFKQGLLIRTCPDSPRPGALENVEAHTPVELLNGIRYLGRGMLNPELPDYDPLGCLCIMGWIEPACSAVMALGQDEIVVAPAHNGATAAIGSAITITLAETLPRHVNKAIISMELNDGMEHHELEFVWRSGDTGGWKQLFNRLLLRSRVHYTSLPVITQVRGLDVEKEATSPPPVVNGEPLHIKGNVPTGTVIQQNLIDVAKGDLSDCMELEQMVKDGTIPDDLVIYVPGGSTNCHAAGVALKNRLAIIYGLLPQDNGTRWTEVDGWVTTQEDVEPSPYDPSLFKDYYFMGCEDGDRFWQYGSVVLSQFFHTFIQKPRNDPRFEAYLAGVYSTWILKATLAVAMGEGRHAYLGQKASFGPVHGLIHIFLTTVFNGCIAFPWGDRSAYYEMFQNKEIGLENIHLAFEAYHRLFAECVWSGSSYGGKNYKESVEKGLAASKAMLKFKQGEADLSDVLDAVNILENAVHNCSFFFNKFINDKKYFDIGTHHHKDFENIERQFHIAAAFHYRFYHDRINEPHVVWDGYNRPHSQTFSEYRELQSEERDILEKVIAATKETAADGSLTHIVEVYPTIEDYMRAFTQGFGGSYCEDCDSHDCGCVDGVPAMTHHFGTCGLEACSNNTCKSLALAEKYGLTLADLKPLKEIFSSSVSLLESHYSLPYTNEPQFVASDYGLSVAGVIEKRGIEKPKVFAQDIENLGIHCHSEETTVFTTEKRELIGPTTAYEIYTDETMLDGMHGDEWVAPMVFKTPSKTVVFAGEMQKQVWRKWCDYFDNFDYKEVLLSMMSGERFHRMEEMLQDMKTCLSTSVDGESLKTYLVYQYTRSLPSDDWRSWDVEVLYMFYLRRYLMIRWQPKGATLLTFKSHPFALGLEAADIFQILLTKFDLDFVKEVLHI